MTPTRFDRLLAGLLRFVVTGLIAVIAAVCVISSYWGFMHLVQVHFEKAGWMLGIAVVSGVTTYALGTRRNDLADC